MHKGIHQGNLWCVAADMPIKGSPE